MSDDLLSDESLADLRDVIEQQRSCCLVESQPNTDPTRSDASPLIFPGAFNPLHRGHAVMASHAKKVFDAPVDFELSVTNVDKTSLTFEDVLERIRQFPEARIWITNAPTFFQKAELFPNSRFVIGADTAVRLFDVKYYADADGLGAAISVIDNLGCRFVVFGRKIGDRFMKAEDFIASQVIPRSATHLFDWISEDDFRVDVSSSEIRSKRKS